VVGKSGMLEHKSGNISETRAVAREVLEGADSFGRTGTKARA